MTARCAFLILPAFLAACQSSPSGGHPPIDAVAAIRAAMSSSAGKAAGLEELFPKRMRSVSCVIRGGGPPPGIRVPGECESLVDRAADGSAVASFIETWDGRRFRGPGSAAKPGLNHTWEFHLDGSNKVTSSRSFGDFPPQSVK
jgi:hypothetical protein